MATNNTFRRINGAFFREGEGGSQVVSDPTTLRQLMSGDIGYSTEATTKPTDRFISPSALTPTQNSNPVSTPTPTLPTGNQPTQTPTQQPAPQGPNPMDSFNLLMTDMLKGAQGLNTADLLKKKRALTRTAIDTTTQLTPEDLRTLSPDQQDAIRNGRTQALRPDIDQNAYELEKAEQSIDNFFRVFGEAKKLGTEWAEKMVAPESVVQNARKIIEANPESLSTILAGFNDKTKEKILGGLDYSKLAKKKDPVSLSAGASLVDPVTGKIIATAPQKNDGTNPTGVTPTTLAGFPPDIQAAAQSIFDGKSKLNEYPSAKRLQINQALSKIYTATGGNELAQGAYSAILLLEKHPGMAGAIGAKGPTSLFGVFSKPIEGSQAAGFLKALDTLKANIKLVNIKYLKGTGALSDAEGKTLEDAGTSLDPALPEAQFKQELARVKAALLKANNIDTSGGGTQIKVTAPNGSVYTFPDQASADAFKKSANIK